MPTRFYLFIVVTRLPEACGIPDLLMMNCHGSRAWPIPSTCSFFASRSKRGDRGRVDVYAVHAHPAELVASKADRHRPWIAATDIQGCLSKRIAGRDQLHS